ncbi:hypothetical protein KSP40_PGU017620 [Platanthera guangdongensis]|uniref:C2H2-type domain-containing protein n=1 Tax=Platanthera guangdongensis TaxID=2320717 RepID=A0ABR2LUG8_9ASPA
MGVHGCQRGDEFKCKTCGRSFVTHQALGGHRTGHTRMRERDGGMTKAAAAAAEDKSRIVHVCEICGAGFLKGRALGKHMRRRHDDVVGRAACSLWERAVRRRRNAVDLDLNLVPADEEEGELPELTLKLGLVISSGPGPVLARSTSSLSTNYVY